MTINYDLYYTTCTGIMITQNEDESFSSINAIYMIAAICLTYIVCTTVGIVIPTTVSVLFHFSVL